MSGTLFEGIARWSQRAVVVNRPVCNLATVEHQLPPGSKLPEEALAEVFGVSRTEVTEYRQQQPALDIFHYFQGRTEAWGMVQDRRGKQLRVQPLSPQRCFFVCHANSLGLFAVFTNVQNGEERFLRKLNVTDLLHAFLTVFLLLQQLFLTADVAAIAFRQNVFTQLFDDSGGA